MMRNITTGFRQFIIEIVWHKYEALAIKYTLSNKTTHSVPPSLFVELQVQGRITKHTVNTLPAVNRTFPLGSDGVNHEHSLLYGLE